MITKRWPFCVQHPCSPGHEVRLSTKLRVRIMPTGDFESPWCRRLSGPSPQRLLVAPGKLDHRAPTFLARISTSAKSRPGFPQLEMAPCERPPVAAIMGAGGDGDARQGHAGQVR